MVTFAFAHCETVCPLIVREAVRAQEVLADLDPVLVVVTLDPWRDTPARLGYAARHWGLDRRNGHALSGSVQEVTAALDRWAVGRARNASTGEITHAPLVYLVDREGIITYSSSGGTETLVALGRHL